jgi:hypothetical protein
MQESRRTFIAAAVASAIVAPAAAMPAVNRSQPGQLIHQVFFWLRSRGSKEDLDKLLAGLRTLRAIESVRGLYIGVPADTEERDVVDASYSASELMFFDDLAGQKAYQDHPVHGQFVETCGHLWEKVIVYDSMRV